MAATELSGELTAMAAIENAIGGLSEDIQHRVLRWACERFGLQAAPSRRKGPGEAARDDTDEATDTPGNVVEATTLAEFYDTKAPSSDADKALVVAYWKQFKEGEAEVESQAINTALKHLGYGVGNITRAFEALKAQRPAPIVQLRKEGKSQQARKKFKVTAEGKKAVEKMSAPL